MRTMWKSVCRLSTVLFLLTMPLTRAGAATIQPVLFARRRSDSTRVAGRTRMPPQTVWISGGVGATTIPAAAVSASINYTYGDLFATFREGETEQRSVGDGVKNNSFMSGLRLGDPHAFATVAVGPTLATHFHNCDCTSATTDVAQLGFGFEIGAHTTAPVVGAGLTLYGIAAGSHARYVSLMIVLDVGWFGPRR